VDDAKFWVKSYALPAASPSARQLAQPLGDTITPDQLFGNE
jgi:hypothetical protein